MKKITILALVLLFSLPLIMGCGGGRNDSDAPPREDPKQLVDDSSENVRMTTERIFKSALQFYIIKNDAMPIDATALAVDYDPNYWVISISGTKEAPQVSVRKREPHDKTVTSVYNRQVDHPKPIYAVKPPPAPKKPALECLGLGANKLTKKLQYLCFIFQNNSSKPIKAFRGEILTYNDFNEIESTIKLEMSSQTKYCPKGHFRRFGVGDNVVPLTRNFSKVFYSSLPLGYEIQPGEIVYLQRFNQYGYVSKIGTFLTNFKPVVADQREWPVTLVTLSECQSKFVLKKIAFSDKPVEKKPQPAPPETPKKKVEGENETPDANKGRYIPPEITW